MVSSDQFTIENIVRDSLHALAVVLISRPIDRYPNQVECAFMVGVALGMRQIGKKSAQAAGAVLSSISDDNFRKLVEAIEALSHEDLERLLE